MLRRVATVGCCWLKFEKKQWSIFSRNICGCWMMLKSFGQVLATMLRQGMRTSSIPLATCHNTSQHGGQTHATRCAQQCCDMLHRNVAIIWPWLGTTGPTMLRYVALICCDFLAGDLAILGKAKFIRSSSMLTMLGN